jgi:thiol-disulfide isomerase/thioredoxin
VDVKSHENPPPAKAGFSDPKTFILGYFKRDRMLVEPYSEWFIKGYDDYSFNSQVVNSLLDISQEGISIKIVMGTWCPDSRREVPRFMKILDLWHFPDENLILIGVDNAKTPSVPEYKILNIERVPTFIIYKNKVETGRIIETPVTSLEQDLLNILKN